MTTAEILAAVPSGVRYAIKTDIAGLRRADGTHHKLPTPITVLDLSIMGRLGNCAVCRIPIDEATPARIEVEVAAMRRELARSNKATRQRIATERAIDRE